MLRLMSTAFTLLSLNLLQAQEGQPTFARFLGPETMFFLHVRGELYRTPIVQKMMDELPGSRAAFESMFQESIAVSIGDLESFSCMMEAPTFVDSVPRQPRIWILFTSRKPLDFDHIKKAIGAPLGTPSLGRYTLHVGNKGAFVRLSEREVVMLIDQGKQQGEIRFDALPSFAHPGQAPIPAQWKADVINAQAADQPLYLAFHFPDKLREQAETGMTNAPAMVTPLKALLKHQHVSLAMKHLPREKHDVQFHLHVRFPDERKAMAGLGAVRYAFSTAKMAIKSMPPDYAKRTLETFWTYASKTMQPAIEGAITEQQGNDVHCHITTSSAVFGPVFTMLVQKVRVAANKTLSSSNMRQLMIAMHNYHNDHDCLPPVMTMKDGKPLHSWRVLVLPYLEQNELYRQLRLEEPWNSEHNLKVFQSHPIPPYYAHPSKPKEGLNTTQYLAFYSSKNGNQSACFRLGSKVTLGQLVVNDGTSQTLALVETTRSVLWYEPVDFEFDGDKPFSTLLPLWPGDLIQVAFFDASIRSFSSKMDPAQWKALVTWKGGEAIDLEKWSE